MRKSIVEMREERARIFEELKALNDKVETEGRDFYAEEQKKWDTANEAVDDLAKAIDAAERKERIEKLDDTFDDRRPKWAADAERSEEQEFERKLRSFMTRGGDPSVLHFGYNQQDVADIDAKGRVNGNGGRIERRDLTTGMSNAPIPVSFIRRLREHLIENSAIRQAGPTVLITESGEDITVPKTASYPAAAIVAEAAAIGESDPSFGVVTLEAFKYAFLTQLSSEFIQDEAVNVLEFLARQGGQALANGSGAHFVSGTGSGQPNGVATASSAGKTGASGQTTTVTGDDLIDLYHSIVTGYRGRGVWLMKDGTVAAVRKIKDTTGQYLWQPGLQQGQPDLLLGKPVLADPNVAAMAASAKSILFGDFSGYYIRDVGSVRIERSDEFAFANDLVTFRFIFRTDGDLVDTTAVKHYANAAS